MADTIEIVEQVATVLEVAGPAGPQGVAGASQADVLTQQGDMLYRSTVAARLPIGTAGQILKVNSGGTAPEWGAAPASGVTSVNGETGAVVITQADLNSTIGNNDLQEDIEELQSVVYAHGDKHNATGSDPILNEMVKVASSGNANINGYYYLANNGGPVDYIKIGSRRRAELVFVNSRWEFQYDGVAQYQSEIRNNSNKPWESTTWTNVLGNSQINPVPTVTQANLAEVNEEVSRLVDYSGAAKLGSTSGLPVKTGTDGIIEAGSFGASAGTFCEGNDPRLSDSRQALAHKSSHAIGGTDFLAPSDIGAQSIFETANVSYSSDTTLTAARAKQYNITALAAIAVTLPTSGHLSGDVVVIYNTFGSSNILTVRIGNPFSQQFSVGYGHQLRWKATGTGATNWELVQVDTHTHVVADVTGAAASGSITTSGLTQSTARLIGRTSSGTGAPEELSASDVRSFLNVADGAEVNVQADWNASSGDAQILNKPTLGTAAAAATTDFAAASHTHPASAISDSTTAGRALLTAADAAAQRTSLGLGSASTRAIDAISDADFRVVGSSDATKKIAFEADTNISASTTRTFTAPNRNGTMVVSDTSAGSGSDVVNNIVSLTQAEYNAIGSPDAATLYLITDP